MSEVPKVVVLDRWKRLRGAQEETSDESSIEDFDMIAYDHLNTTAQHMWGYLKAVMQTREVSEEGRVSYAIALGQLDDNSFLDHVDEIAVEGAADLVRNNPAYAQALLDEFYRRIVE